MTELKNQKLDIRLTEELRSKIDNLYKEQRRPRGEIIRELLSTGKINSVINRETYLELIRLRADLGRLGGLFKLSFTTKSLYKKDEREKILKEIKDTQSETKKLIKKILTTLK